MIVPPAPTCPTCGAELAPDAQVCLADGTVVAVDPNEPTLRRDVLLGVTLGEYLVEERIGSGGMGIVYRARQPLISKRVAIKVLRPDIASNPVEVERILTEARTVNEIGHRGVIDIFGAGTVPDGRYYLVMEYLEGSPLDAVIAEKAPLPYHDAIRILEQLLDPLEAVHAAGVVHRDLKPSNIFVVSQRSGGSYLKILDFGLAKQGALVGGSTPQTSDSRVCGTPEFMAPEQARGQPVSPRTDLYAVGCIAFQLLTGRMPFTAPSPLETLMKHLEAPAPRPSHFERSVPRQLDDFVLRLLAKDPAARPESALVARGDLKGIVRELSDQQTHFHARGEAQPWEVKPEPGDRQAPLTIRNTGKFGFSRRTALLLAVWLGAFTVVAVMGRAVLNRSELPVPRPVDRARPSPPLPAPAAEAAPAPAPKVEELPALAGQTPPVEPPAPPPERATRETRAHPTARAPAKAKTGELVVSIRGWGEVRIDGVDQGRVPPKNTFELSAGAHVLEIHNPNARPYRAEVTIPPGGRVVHRVELQTQQ